ncbi:potassium channel family protein [Jatrophihabitans fulvus]
MHIVIMGCGRVGAALSLQLATTDHTLAVIDQDPLAFRRLGENFPGRMIRGVGFDRETLVEAGIEEAGAFAAVSSGDNSNIIAARVARETFGVTRVVARIYDPRRAEVYERLGIPTVATVPWTASRLMKTVLGEATAEAWRDPTGHVALVAVAPHEGWVGRPLADLEAATGTRAALYNRFGTGALPTPSTLIQSGDKVYLLAADEQAAGLRDVVGRAPDGSE